MKSLLRLLMVSLLVTQVALAQKTITGVVSDDQGMPLPGATVLEQGTSNGVSTDFDGNYSIEVAEGSVLEYSFVGYETSAITVGADDQINVSLAQGNELEEVIVTSLGIKREKQALGYAVSEVESDQLEQRAEGDIGRVLAGKASGVQITNASGVSGSGTSIVIRGFNTFSQGNQPLFIVDGVPFASDTNAQGSFVDGNSGSSRFLDIDPNNIESVNVLKGLAASNLYGTQGRNGVILITTKSGSTAGSGAKKTEITVNTSYFNVELASQPDYQMQYGNGFDQSFGWFFSNWGPSFDEGGPAGWGGQSSINGSGSWDSSLIGPNAGQSVTRGYLKHPYVTQSRATGTYEILELIGLNQTSEYKWQPYDSVGGFFVTGHTASTNMNLRGASDDGKISYNINYGNLEDKGFTRENSLRRNTLSFGGRAQLSNGFTINGTLNYSQTNFKSPPVAAGYGSNVGGEGASVFANVFYTPRSVDLIGLPDTNPVTNGSLYYRNNNGIQNPIWTTKNAANTQLVDRVFGGANISYNINDNLNVSYRYGLDVYSENNVNYANKGGKTGSLINQNGIYETWNNRKQINDHNLSIAGSYKFGEIGADFTIGYTTRGDVYDRNGTRSIGQQVYGVLRHFNYEQQDEIQYYEARNIKGLYGQASFDYQRYAYLTLSARQDWVSNLSMDNRSITYPSASVSFLPTSAFPEIKSDMLNLLKVRASYGTSANFPFGYPISATLTLDTQDFLTDAGGQVISNTSGSRLGNPNLKPETISEIEFGIEGRFLDSRLSLDLSVYNKKTNDLIITRPLDPSTGYSSTQTNIGEIENKGVEVDLGIDVLRGQDLNWSAFINYSANESIVTDLGLDTEEIVYSGFSNLGNVARVGESLGAIVGSKITTTDAGGRLVNNQGSYDTTFGTNIIGDANPNFLLNISNSISYKNFSFNFLINHVNGGDIYSMTVATMLGRGLTNDTLDRELSFILPGVNSAGEVNTRQINNSTFYFSNVLYGPDELQIYDGSVWRLGEISLTYDMPQSLIDKTPFGGISLTASGYNLWYNAYNTPEGVNFDPNIAGTGVGNGRGFDYLNGPSARRYGASLKLTF
ncbi:MAG: SusC/RagA family TonB-linked outer membrane protein [Flavobacteriaceae bacterium]|nr:SusC/RagA family TonB-linked outer membrane protein [Flavobacteriaceae bacterium]